MLKNVFKKVIKVIKEPEIMRLQKYQADFITIDSMKHKSVEYNWVNGTGLRCCVPSYIMIDVKRDGYLIDIDGNYYTLNNIISISWNKLDEKIVLYKSKYKYQIIFDDEEVMKMDEYIKEEK